MRNVEIFVAGCTLCEQTVKVVQRIACPSCNVTVQDMHDAETAKRAQQLGIRQVPAVVVDEQLVACCAGGPDEAPLRAAGIGTA